MEKSFKTKQRLLYVMDIFKHYSDINTPISINTIIDKLANYDIKASKYALYDDIDALKDYGFDISYVHNSGYFYNGIYDITDLKIIIDSINASNFIDETRSSNIINNILLETSFNQKQLLLNTLIKNPLKSKNNKAIYNIDTLVQAIENDIEVSFKYFDYDIDFSKKYRKNNANYHLIPYGLYWHNQYYYCIGYNSKYNNLQHYRLDKMANIKLIEKIYKPYFDLQEYTSRFIDMYIADKTNVTLKCKRKLSNVIIDKFNGNMLITEINDDYFIININVDPSITFISWLFTFKKEIEVLKPQSLIDDIKLVLNQIMELYFND